MKKALIALVCCAAIHAQAKDCKSVQMVVEVAAMARDMGKSPSGALEQVKEFQYDSDGYSDSDLRKMVDMAYTDPILKSLHGKELMEALNTVCASGP
jgi:hypothetical protein